MYQEPEEQLRQPVWATVASCLSLALRLCFCINRDDDAALSLGDSARSTLLDGRDRRSEAAIETALSPPRAPLLEPRSPAKGAPAGSVQQQHLLHPLAAAHQQRQQRHAAEGTAAAAAAGSGGHARSGSGASGGAALEGGSPTKGGGGSGGEGEGGGTSPTKAGLDKGKHQRSQSALSLLDDEEFCPTCLEPYSEDNPKVTTKCNHHFHLPCIYEWLERSETCPMCGCEMKFEEVV